MYSSFTFLDRFLLELSSKHTQTHTPTHTHNTQVLYSCERKNATIKTMHPGERTVSGRLIIEHKHTNGKYK